MDSALGAAKSELRRLLRRRGRGLGLDRDAAARALAALAPLERWPAARFVAAYQPSAIEIDPGPLLARLGAAGATPLLPVVVARASPLVFREARADVALTPDAAGIPAPPPSSLQARPALVLAPLLAFDAAGGRLGQGGGYYDRTLRALRAEGPVWAVGLAFADQEVDHVPMGPHDERLDAILTERGYSEP